MRCMRCDGWMVLDDFIDLLDDSGGLYCTAWRCVNCGAVVDHVILRHQPRLLAVFGGSPVRQAAA